MPWFATLFGRDAIIASLQSLAFRPQIAIETLDVLAAYQATEVDDWRDAEPGKILHELRTGEMAGAGELPHTPYYGSIDSTPLWLILFGGDLRLDRRSGVRRPALAERARAPSTGSTGTATATATASSSTSGARPRGLLNQGWKDSGDCDPRPERRASRPSPIALAEVQGYVFDAKRRMAGLAAVRGEDDLADAAPVRGRGRSGSGSRTPSGSRTSATTRWPSTARSAGSTRSARTPASASGPGSSSPARARDVADRLLSPAMFSGWGIRTYAADQPGYNPIGYHTGSVWPHDTSLIAAGLKRYGFDEESNRLVGHVFQAAQHFPDVPPAGAVLRVRPRPLGAAGAVSGRLLAAGLGGRRVVPVPRDDARAPGAAPAGASSSCTTRTCPTGSARSR